MEPLIRDVSRALVGEGTSRDWIAVDANEDRTNGVQFGVRQSGRREGVGPRAR